MAGQLLWTALWAELGFAWPLLGRGNLGDGNHGGFLAEVTGLVASFTKAWEQPEARAAELLAQHSFCRLPLHTHPWESVGAVSGDGTGWRSVLVMMEWVLVRLLLGAEPGSSGSAVSSVCVSISQMLTKSWPSRVCRALQGTREHETGGLPRISRLFEET